MTMVIGWTFCFTQGVSRFYIYSKSEVKFEKFTDSDKSVLIPRLYKRNWMNFIETGELQIFNYYLPSIRTLFSMNDFICWETAGSSQLQAFMCIQ